MSRVPVLKPREVIRALERLGFVEVRQRGAHRQFRFAPYRPRQHEVCDIRTCDHKQQPGGRKQYPQDRISTHIDLVMHPRDVDLIMILRLVDLRMRSRHPAIHRAQFRTRGFYRCARSKPREDLRHAMLAARHHRRGKVMRTGNHVGNNLGRHRIRNRWLQHSHHRR